MTVPLLSICIPTFNRGIFLRDALESIVQEPVFAESNKIEIVISDNGSTDNTREVCLEFVERFPTKIFYEFLSSPVTGDENFILVLNRGRGKYLKLHNDKLICRPESLESIINLLESRDVGNVLFLANCKHFRYETDAEEIREFYGSQDLFGAIMYNATNITCFCVRKEAFQKIENPGRYSYLHFAQVWVLAHLAGQTEKCTVLMKELFFNHPDFIYKRGFSIPKVFGPDFNRTLQFIVQDSLLTKRLKKKIQLYYLPEINNTFFYESQWTPGVLVDYMSSLFPIYWNCSTFYSQFVRLNRKAFSLSLIRFYIRHPNLTFSRFFPALFHKIFSTKDSQ